MDARTFYQSVVRPNFAEYCRSQNDFRLLWNVLVSMNTVAEHVALERLEYSQVKREVLNDAAKQIRDETLQDLKFCAEALKHVRKIDPKAETRITSELTTTATSTGIDPADPTNGRYIDTTLEKTMTLRPWFVMLSRRS
jgi:hypothetical protein